MKRRRRLEVCTYWYLAQVELAIDGSKGWRVTGGLCCADMRNPTANRHKLKHVPVGKKLHTSDTVSEFQ